jgi:hypothetical protein
MTGAVSGLQLSADISYFLAGPYPRSLPSLTLRILIPTLVRFQSDSVAFTAHRP